jgi:hypothetical protein
MTLTAAVSDHAPAPLLEAHLTEQLEAARQEFTRPRQQIEGAFLDIGRILIEGNNLLRGITAAFENLASRLEGGDTAGSFGPFEIISQARARLGSILYSGYP